MSRTPEPRARDRYAVAALALFAEHGYAGTSLQAIADRVGVSKAAVTYHFPSKVDLLDVLLEPLITDFGAVLDHIEGLDDPAERRRSGLPAYTDLLLRHRRVLAWLSRDISVLDADRLQPVLATLSDRRDRLLASGSGPLGQIWGGAISAAMIEAVSSAPADVDDGFLRGEVEQIGETLVAGAVAAHERHGLPNPGL